MSKIVLLTDDEIYNITSAVQDRIRLLEENTSSYVVAPYAHKRLKEFKEIVAKLND